MKPLQEPEQSSVTLAFSILERIDVGETQPGGGAGLWPGAAFSILERIDVGETFANLGRRLHHCIPFSILERIDVGETSSERVKQVLAENFQYPRTDRRG